LAKLPAGHSSHADAPAAGTYVQPGTWQSLHEEAQPGEKVPAPQGSHSLAVVDGANDPAPQMSHRLAPTGERLPTEHALQVEAPLTSE
jgi:hypothetical protein